MRRNRTLLLWALLTVVTVVLTACNLTSSPQQPIELTALPTSTLTPPAQVTTTAGVQVTSLPFFTQVAPPTSVAFIPPTAFQPIVATPTPSTISIVILSPIPGNVVAQNVQVLGSATHPNFLQYVVEYGPDPNPNNLWYPIAGARTTPVLNGVLGIWTTNTIPDGLYQLRLRVYLRDGSTPQTVVNNLRVQNTAPTPVPTNTASIPRPIAAFSADRTFGEPPLVVRFTDRSTGQITSYNWNFGDGSSSAERNPTHVFRQPGEYEVRLTVSGPGGQSNVSQVVDVVVNPPSAAFDFTPPSGTAPLTVQFTDRSVGQVTSYQWDFGDGTRSTDRNPSHTYQAQGTYNVFLRVRGPGGANRARAIVTVVNPQIPAPVASFQPSEATGDAPFTLQFTNTSTGQITGYLWNFGDGNTSADASPIHQYQQPGIYNVNLTVTGPGGSSNARGVITVNRAQQAPDAAFTASIVSGDAPLNVQFTNQTTGDVTTFVWELGDGNSTNDRELTYTFTQPGTYVVRLTAYGQNNLSDFAEVTISVTKPLIPPQAAFTVNPTTGTAPLDVEIANQSSGDNITYRWDLGDGTTSQTSDALFRHTYAQPGTYTLTLTVSGAGGRDSIATAQVTVVAVDQPLPTNTPTDVPSAVPPTDVPTDVPSAVPPTDVPTDVPSAVPPTDVPTEVPSAVPPTDVPTDVPTSVPAPVAGFTQSSVTDLTVTVQDLSTDATSWQWDFGDGVGFSTDQNPQPYTYAQGGTYTITLTVQNAGGSNSTTQQVTVTAPIVAPVAGFTQSSVTDLTVTVQDLSTDATSWQWDFGDGVGFSTDQNPQPYTYAQGGTYTITLTVQNAGGSNSTTQQVTVTAPAVAPSADFTFAADALTVSFTDASSSDAESRSWDFGDGNTSSDLNPTHTYAAAGLYNVTLTVTRAGLSATVTYEVSVEAPAPQPNEADQAEIFPDIDGQASDLTNINANSDGSLQPIVFSVLGDRSVDPSGFLAPFGDGNYSLDGSGFEVDSALQAFLSSDVGGQNTLARIGAAISDGNTVDAVLNGAGGCGDTVVNCEITAAAPTVMLISLGQRDAQNQTDLAQFESSLTALVETVKARGVIPVLLTPYDTPDVSNVGAYAAAVVRVADAEGVPLVNVWRLFKELPNGGLSGGTPSVDGGGADVLNDGAISQFGHNARNFAVLSVLSDIRASVFGQ